MALIEPKTYHLKNGTSFTVRVGEQADATQLIENGKHFVENGDGQVLVPGELNPSLEDEYKWIENHRSKSNNLLLVAEIHGRLLGHIDFYGANRKRLQHTGHFGMGVRQEYRSQGVGRALLSRMIEWAQAHPVIEKINLQVVGDNTKAIALYQSLGFIEDGRKRNEIRLENGTAIDDVSMGLTLRK
jgi:RimJ/RimL family protein N-acetyltransferase